jgi:four helix bundle protein
MATGYKNLDVYQRAYKQVKEIHKMSHEFPDVEKYEIGSQIRRAALSIVLNIAEGYGRKDSAGEFQHFLRMAMGSSNEVRVLLDLIKDLGYIAEAKHQELEEEYEIIGRQLYKLRETAKKN